MKRTLIVLMAAMLSVCGTTYAQKNAKLGHINSTELMQIMPGRDSAQASIQTEVDALQSQLKNMQDELEKKYNDYTEKQSQYSELIKQTKQKELQDMNTRIQQFQDDAQKQLQTKEQTLLQPIIDRAKQAITDVAKENGYTYIFDSGVGVLLYQQDGDDIMPLVKKKLNLK